MHAREWAKAQWHREQVGDFEAPPMATWADDRLIEEDPLPWSIADWHPTGSNSVIAAAFKTGKTALGLNICRALADQTPFLGNYDVAFPDGRVVYLNFEVSQRQLRDWIKRMPVEHADRIVGVHLRGRAFSLADPVATAWLVETLKRAEAQAVVIDPYAHLLRGVGDENSNTDAAAVTALIDDIKQKAGVPVHLVAHRTARRHRQSQGPHPRSDQARRLGRRSLELPARR